MENEEVTSVDDHEMKEISAVSQRLQEQVKVQTPDGTTVGNIMLRQEKELEKIRFIVAAMEKELNQHLEEEQNGTTQTDARKKNEKGKTQQEKKRKRKNEDLKEETEEEMLKTVKRLHIFKDREATLL